MTYYVTVQKNNFDIETVFSISETFNSLADYQFDEAPYIGQYVIEGQLIPPSEYDSRVAPIIAGQYDTAAGIVAETVIYQEENNTPTQESQQVEEVQEQLAPTAEPITEETLDSYRERVFAIENLIQYAQDPSHYNSDGDLVLTIYPRSMEQREEPLVVAVGTFTPPFASKEAYISSLQDVLAHMRDTVIPFLEARLAT